MELNLIKYQNKACLNENTDIPAINKILAEDMNEIKYVINNYIFPIGATIENSEKSFNPNLLYGGTWVRIKGKFLVGVDEDDEDFNESGKTGGEKKHTLTIDEMPRHDHDGRVNNAYASGNELAFHANGNSIIGGMIQQNGGGQPHNNIPPFEATYIWRRVA